MKYLNSVQSSLSNSNPSPIVRVKLVGKGVDFVFALSQQQDNKNIKDKKNPCQNFPEGSVLPMHCQTLGLGLQIEMSETTSKDLLKSME